MFVFSRSFLIAYLLVTSTFIECGPLNKASSVKNGFTSNSSLDSASLNDSTFASGDASNESFPTSGNLVNDDPLKPVAIESGNNVLINAPGHQKLKIPGKRLDIGVNLNTCVGKTLICYKAKASRIESHAQQPCSAGYCGFKLTAADGKISGHFYHKFQRFLSNTNTFIRMKFDLAAYGGDSDYSCDPAFEDGDILDIDVQYVAPGCPLQISDAKVYHEPEPTAPSVEKAESSNAGLQWYIWFIIVAVIILFILLVIAGIAICWDQKIICFKVRPPKKIRKMDTDSMNSMIIAKAEPPTIKSKEPTKDTTVASKIEKTTDDEVVKPPVPPPKPAKKLSHPPKKITPQEVQTAIKSLQKNDPLEKADRPTQPSLLTKPKSTASLKSAISRRHRDSRDEGEYNFHVAMEPPYSCMGRHAFIDKTHIESAEQKLLEKHNVLMEDGRILVHINPNGAAAQYLQKVTTPEYVRLTAFGGQYGRRISLDAKLMDEYSMPLLMVIAFTPYINEGYRRHALALMKRNAPTIIQGTLAKERKKYGFPCNALDAAYKKDPFCFENVDKNRTYSSPNLSEANSSGTKKTTIEESKEVPAKLRRNTLK